MHHPRRVPRLRPLRHRRRRVNHRLPHQFSVRAIIDFQRPINVSETVIRTSNGQIQGRDILTGISIRARQADPMQALVVVRRTRGAEERVDEGGVVGAVVGFVEGG